MRDAIDLVIALRDGANVEVSPMTVAKWLSGDSAPRYAHLRALQQIFGSVERFFPIEPEAAVV